MSEPIAMMIKSRSQAGKRDELLALYQEHLAPRAEANDAQQIVVWSADQHDPDVFYLFELYRDAAAMGANASADWFFAYLQAAGPLLDGEPEVGIGEPRWSKGV